MVRIKDLDGRVHENFFSSIILTSADILYTSENRDYANKNDILLESNRV